VREVKLTLDDVREHLYLLQGDEIDLWWSVQNLEYNAEDTLPIVRELFARMQPAQVGTPNGVVRHVVKYVTKSPNYLPQHH
jgi:hypothetical protein